MRVTKLPAFLKRVVLFLCGSCILYTVYVKMLQTPSNKVVYEEAGKSIAAWHMHGHDGTDRMSGNSGFSACEVLHIAVTCVGSTQASEAALMVKSLGLYRRNPLSLHFMTDANSAASLNTLFDTWELPQVTVQCHILKDLKQVPNIDRLHVQKLLEVIDVLRKDGVEKVLLVHPRMRFLTDVAELWQHFSTFLPSQVIGVIKWPNKKGAAYNLNVVLLNLSRIRQSNIYKAIHGWKPGSFSQGEISDLFMSHTPEVSHIPCAWAISFDPVTKLETCLQGEQPKMALWSGSVDQFTKDATQENIKEMIESIHNMNGELLRTSTLPCRPEESPKSDIDRLNANDWCYEFRLATTMKRRTHTNFISDKVKQVYKTPDVTLMTQFTLDRFPVFEVMMRHWTGPASVTMHATDADAIKLRQKVQQSKVLQNRKNVAYHIVYKRQKFYPINYLRNVAVEQAETSHAFFVDVDLVPMPGLHKYLKEAVEKYSDKRKKTALVVPAFEAFKKDLPFPKNRKELLRAMTKGTVDGYSMRRGWNLGHSPTNYKKWKTATQPYVVPGGDAFEPYVVLATSDMPPYDNRLLERFGDKIAYGVHLHAEGYELKVLDKGFVIHLPHPPSSGTLTWRAYPPYTRCSSIIHKEVRRDIAAKKVKSRIRA